MIDVLIQTLFFSGDHATIKDHSLCTIAEYPGLTCKQIYQLVRKARTKTTSFQAVHKALQQLEDTKILNKQERKYFVSTTWITQTKNYLELATQKLAKTSPETELLVIEVQPEKMNRDQSRILLPA